MPIVWTPKQQEFGHLERIAAKFIFNRGAIRSGKSKTMTHAFLHWAHRLFGGYTFGLAGENHKQLQSVTLAYAEEWCWEVGVKLRGHEQTEIEIPSRHGRPNKFLCYDGATSRSANKILSVTLQGLFCEEIVTMRPEFIKNAFDRVSLPHGKIVANYNPLGPMHWFKTDYEDGIGGLDPDHPEDLIKPHLTVWYLDDNPVNTREYIGEVKARYRNHPADYERKVNGNWAASAGLVYANAMLPAEHEKPKAGEYRNVRFPPKKRPHSFSVGVDFGSRRVTHAVLGAHFPDGVYIVDEWRHDGYTDGILSETEQAARIARWASPFKPREIYVDSTATALRHALTRAFGVNAQPGSTDLLESIQFVSWLFDTHQLYVSPKCRWVLRELGSYSWDENTRDKDKPALGNDHGMDALRYLAVNSTYARAVRATHSHVGRAIDRHHPAAYRLEPRNPE